MLVEVAGFEVMPVWDDDGLEVLLFGKGAGNSALLSTRGACFTKLVNTGCATRNATILS